MPKRKFETVKEFEAHIQQAEELIFDGTENLTERPQNNDKQKDKYSVMLVNTMMAKMLILVCLKKSFHRNIFGSRTSKFWWTWVL